MSPRKSRTNGSVTVSALDRAVTIGVEAFRSATVTRATLDGFAESQGVVSIEPHHVTRNVDAGERRWTRIDDYGRTGSGMRATAPASMPAAGAREGARLEYQMQLFTPGALTTTVILAPTLNFMPDRPLQVAVSIDDEPPQVVTIVPAGYDARNGNRDWENSVRNNARTVTTTHRVERAGPHVLKVWMIDPGVVVQKIVVDTAASRRAPTYLGPPESPRNP